VRKVSPDRELARLDITAGGSLTARNASQHALHEVVIVLVTVRLEIEIGGHFGQPLEAAAAVPLGTPWLWTLVCGQHEDRTPTHGYEATREAAMAAMYWGRE
jgi:hypothetical protein